MRFAVLLLVLSTTCLASEPAPPIPYGVTPSQRQLAWHDREFYGFIHFTKNTFTDKEWGFGDESPSIFAPTDFDADQIVRVAKNAGMIGLILTCKHHDGFCLWPSKYTDHSVKKSPWKNGKGDIVREISDACNEQGLAFGVYLSPWDRNQANYGKPEYTTYYRNQLTELFTNYGPVFEIWFDGANGGDGYYGGARETRKIDQSQYYDWDTTYNLVRELQPSACIFSDAGPDVRWVGNERGIAGNTCWATTTPAPSKGETVPGPGCVDTKTLPSGIRNGDQWIPAEADVSIRPGWFYHESQDAQVRSAENLVDLYFNSVGHGSSLNLNLPPDRRGQIHPKDEASLVGFRKILDETFDENLLGQATVTASEERGDGFEATNLLDADKATYWSTSDDTTDAEVTATFATPVEFNVIDIREYLPLGQRVGQWTLSYWTGEEWKPIATGESIGSRRLWRGPTVENSKIKLQVIGPVCPALSEFGVYLGPFESDN